MPLEPTLFDALIIGSGVSGSFVAKELVSAGWRCLMLEAGEWLDRTSYPTDEIDGNGRLYWGGGIELNHDATMGLLRPKVVGGGSIVNQALMDRFDAEAFIGWYHQTGIADFSLESLAPYYDRAEKELHIEETPAEYWNRNSRIFQDGFKANGYHCKPLRRAQKDCAWAEGNDCIECLSGCRRDSKQSMPVTVLKRALGRGLKLIPTFQADLIEEKHDEVWVSGNFVDGRRETFRARHIVLAAGALGNTRLLFQSGYGDKLPHLGRGFFNHPQLMTFARYAEVVDAFRGPFQTLKSDDGNFRQAGFKLENVFAPPVGLAMLCPYTGRKHQEWMQSLRHLACIEVAIRDTNPGRLTVDKKGKLRVEKSLNADDEQRMKAGVAAIRKIYEATGAQDVWIGETAIGLHLMGGCAIGTSPQTSVVGPDFKVHGFPRVRIADSSIFPNAPGINPSLTIMALSIKAAAGWIKEEEAHIAISQ